MQANLLRIVLGTVIAISLNGMPANAVGPQVGAAQKTAAITDDLLAVAFRGAMSMGHPTMGHAMISPHFGGARFAHTMGVHTFHDHRHHNHRFFFVGVPYYVDYDYGNYDDCWWSRRYHRWICSGY